MDLFFIDDKWLSWPVLNLLHGLCLLCAEVLLVEMGVEDIQIIGKYVLISCLETTLLLIAHDGFYALPEQSGVIC